MAQHEDDGSTMTTAFAAGAARRVGMLALVALGACATDRILPVDSVCGDGVVSGSEECDPAELGEGCVECVVQPGWACTEQRCETVCGDGVVTGGEQCDSSDRSVCDSSCGAATRTDGCAMSGWWMMRQTTFSVDDVFNEVQTTSNWSLLHLASGASGAFEVDLSLNCGLLVTGSKVDVSPTPAGTRALLWKSAQDGSTGLMRRVGRSVEGGAGCLFELSRTWYARGLFDSYLPTSGPPWPEFSELEPLPTPEDTTGAEDDDGDGIPGLGWVVSRGASGKRNTSQRDWAEAFSLANESDSRFFVEPNAIEFDARARFDNQEAILKVTECPPAGCGPLRAESTPATDLVHRVRLRYLGQSLDEPRVAAVITRTPREDLDDDYTTCEHVRAALEHDRSSK